MNILALDYGEKRIGTAKGSDETKLAIPFCIIENKNINFVLEKILEIIKEDDINSILIGLPIGLSGKNTDQTKVINDFIILLEEKTNIPIITIDERFTSRGANDLFSDKKKRRIDDIAAMIMLQGYLDKK